MVVFYRNRDFRVKLVPRFRVSDLDPARVCKFFCPGYGFSAEFMEDFKSVFRFSAYCTQSRSYLQSHHSGPRYSHSHAVFEHVPADFDKYVEISVRPPLLCTAVRTLLHEDFYRLCRSERHGYRFRTSECRLYFFLYKFYDFSFPWCHRAKYLSEDDMMS